MHSLQYVLVTSKFSYSSLRHTCRVLTVFVQNILAAERISMQYKFDSSVSLKALPNHTECFDARANFFMTEEKNIKRPVVEADHKST